MYKRVAINRDSLHTTDPIDHFTGHAMFLLIYNPLNQALKSCLATFSRCTFKRLAATVKMINRSDIPAGKYKLYLYIYQSTNNSRGEHYT